MVLWKWVYEFLATNILNDLTIFLMADRPGKVDIHESILNQYKEEKAYRLYKYG